MLCIKSGFRIRIESMQIQIRIRVQFPIQGFEDQLLKIFVQDKGFGSGSGSRVLKKTKRDENVCLLT